MEQAEQHLSLTPATQPWYRGPISDKSRDFLPSVTILAVMAIPASLLASAPALALPSAYASKVQGSGFSGHGVVTIDTTTPYANPYPCATCATGPGYDATGIWGSLNGRSITGLAPLLSIAGNDNRFYPTSAPLLDRGDLGFVANGVAYNVFNGNYAGHPGYFLANGGGIYANPVAFSLTTLPEPASWAMMIPGFAVIGSVLRHRARGALAAEHCA